MLHFAGKTPCQIACKAILAFHKPSLYAPPHINPGSEPSIKKFIGKSDQSLSAVLRGNTMIPIPTKEIFQREQVYKVTWT